MVLVVVGLIDIGGEDAPGGWVGGTQSDEWCSGWVRLHGGLFGWWGHGGWLVWPMMGDGGCGGWLVWLMVAAVASDGCWWPVMGAVLVAVMVLVGGWSGS